MHEGCTCALGAEGVTARRAYAGRRALRRKMACAVASLGPRDPEASRTRRAKELHLAPFVPAFLDGDNGTGAEDPRRPR